MGMEMKRKSNTVINDKYLATVRLDEIGKHFQGAADDKDQSTWTDPKTQSVVIKHPYAACQLRGIFDRHFISNVKKELLDLEFVERSNDLYWFYQSEDLKKVTTPYLQQLRAVLYSTEMRSMMEAITGLELNDTVDIAAQRYPPNGYLLCHDDKLDGRRIAFIVYLVDDDWSEADGGELSLFGIDKTTLLPLGIEGAVTPQFNSLAFFEVTPTSYHQVSEVLGNRERVSIQGWFHGKPKQFARPEQPPRVLSNSLALDKFVRGEYLRNVAAIRDVFEEQGFVQLSNFLLPDVYDLLEAECKSTTWLTVGTPNVCRYQQPETEPTMFGTLTAVLASHAWNAFLESLTAIPTRLLSCEFKQYVHGTYSLLHDHCQEPNGLDAVLSVLPSSSTWDDDWGGDLVYVAGEDTLASFTPQMNTA